MAGIVQLRYDTAGRAYYRRKLAAGKTSMEAMRCLRRRLSDAVYRQLAAEGKRDLQLIGHPSRFLEEVSSGTMLDPTQSGRQIAPPGAACGAFLDMVERLRQA